MLMILMHVFILPLILNVLHVVLLMMLPPSNFQLLHCVLMMRLLECFIDELISVV
jgi:hypothetical protein